MMEGGARGLEVLLRTKYRFQEGEGLGRRGGGAIRLRGNEE